MAAAFSAGVGNSESESAVSIIVEGLVVSVSGSCTSRLELAVVVDSV